MISINLNINDNAQMFLALLFALLLCLLLGILAGIFYGIERKSFSVFVTSILLWIFLFSLLAGVRLRENMIRPIPSFTPKPAPLLKQSQVTIQTWSDSISRSSLSGKDGTVHWHMQVSQPCNTDAGSDQIFVVSDGILYQREFASLEEPQPICIQATRLSDNVRLWSKIFPSITYPEIGPSSIGETVPLQNKLLVANDRLYFQIDGTFYILDSSTGKVLQKIPPDTFHTSATITDFLVNTWALVIMYQAYQSTNDSSIDRSVVVQPITGAILWKSTPGMYDALIALQGTNVYLHTSNQNVVALNVLTSTKLWQVNVPDTADAFPGAATTESLYVRMQKNDQSGESDIYALDARNGRIRWKIPVVTGAVFMTGETLTDALDFTITDTMIYVTDINVLSAYNATTGHLVWQYDPNTLLMQGISFSSPDSAVSFSQPMIVQNVLFVSDAYQNLNLLDSPPDDPICLGPCNIPHTGVLALQASTGKPYWLNELQGTILSISAS